MNRLGVLKKRRRRKEFLRRRRIEKAIRNWVPPPVEEVPFIQERIYPEYPEYPLEEEYPLVPPPESENVGFKL
jgi:hypothetical protein